MALRSYFDGSNDGGWEKGRMITLVRIAGDDSVWCDFEEQWEEFCRDDRERPAVRYMHMREAAALEGEFSWRNN